MYKKDLQNISISLYHVNQNYHEKSRASLVGFFRGYEAALSQRKEYYGLPKFSKLFSDYIHFFHKIRHITWDFQVETYACRNNLEWVAAFEKLYGDFCKAIQWKDDKPSLNLPEEEFEFDAIEIDTSNRLSTYKTKSGLSIQAGTILKFADKVKEEYKNFINYDIYQKEPSWEYSYFGNGKHNYQYIRFFYKKDELNEMVSTSSDAIFHKVEPIWGFHTTEIKFLAERNGKCYAYSDLFEIELESAFASNEITISENRHEMDLQREKDSIWSIRDGYEAYKMGLMTPKGFLLYIYNHNCGHYEKYMNYRFSFSGWYKKNP